MRRYLTAFVIAGLSGFVIGAVLSLRDWSRAWPVLSLLSALRGGAVAWLVGAAVSPVLGWLLSRRATARAALGPSGQRRARWAGACLLPLALAPAALWVTAVLPVRLVGGLSMMGRRPGDDRPNLVLITIDALRTDHVGAYGGPPSLTPNLDAFAREATQYDAAYAASPWTLTSLGAVFTGLPPSQCGLKPPELKGLAWYRGLARLPESRILLSEQLQRAGYTTAADLTNVFLEAERGWYRGFDYFQNEGGADGTNAKIAHARALTGHAFAWMRLNWRRPFFLWVHYLDPHCPYLSPDTPAKPRARYPSHWVARRERWYGGLIHAPEDKRLRYQEFCRMMYDEEVRYADRWVGELLKKMKAAGLYDNSLIVITADHGEELFDRGEFDHGHSMHEEVLSVPLLVKWPKGVEADRRVTQTVATAELASTFLEFAQAPALNGANRLGLPRRSGRAGSEVYSEATLYGLEQTALTTDAYRVIYHPFLASGGERFEVYDRRRDRRERRNLASSGAAPELRARLQQLTEAAHAASQQQASSYQERGPLNLPEQTRRRMRALGYLGN